jgi:hypothetical protein
VDGLGSSNGHLNEQNFRSYITGRFDQYSDTNLDAESLLAVLGLDNFAGGYTDDLDTVDIMDDEATLSNHCIVSIVTLSGGFTLHQARHMGSLKGAITHEEWPTPIE